jgi:hypothetical protein
MHEPNRDKLLMEMVEPRRRKSKTEIEAPNLL